MAKLSRSVLLYLILFGTMFFLGCIDNIKGVSYPLIKAEFNIPYEQQGMMVSIFSLAFVVFCFVGGMILGSFGVKKTFLAGFVFMITGLVSVFAFPLLGLPRILSLAALFFVSAALGLLEVGSNALAAQVFTTRVALLMSLLHFFYGAGSSLSPRFSGAIASGLGWRYIYLLSLPLALIFFVPSIFARFPQEDNSSSAAGGTRRVRFFTALKNPMVWVISVVMGLMVGIEVSSINWAGLYFQDVYNLDPKTSGAAFISNFFIFFTVSRLLSGFAIEKIGYLRSLFIATLAAILVFTIGFTIGAKGIHVLPAVGFFIAVFWPTTLAIGMGYFKEDAPVMTSAIIVLSGALNSVMQFLIGLTNRVVGPAWGYRSCVVYALGIIAALVVLNKRLRHPYKEVC